MPPALGKIIFWVTWPGLWFILRWSYRTRVLITAGDKVLVVRPWLGSGQWTLPGGGVHRGEDVVVAAIREVEEETGLKLRTKQLSLTSERTFRANGLRFRYQECVVVLKSPEDVRPQPGEVEAIEWVDKTSLNRSNAAYDVLAALGHL